MKATLDQARLVEALRTVNLAVERRSTIPILSNVLLRVLGGSATIMGTDLDRQISAVVPEIAGELETTLPADKLLAAIGSFKPGAIEIEADNGKAVLKQGRSQRTLMTLPASEFPQLAVVEGATEFAVQSASLARLLDAVHVAQSDEEARYYLCGVFLHTVDGASGRMLQAAATNGHFMIRAAMAAPAGAEHLRDSIVPTKAVGLIRKLAGKGAELRLRISDRAIEIEAGDVRLVSKLVEGTFPDYQRIIPTTNANRLAVQQSALMAAAEAVTAVVEAEKDRSRKVRFDLGPEPELAARDTTGAEAVEPLDGTYTGEAQQLGLNGRYLAQLAGVFAESSKLEFAIGSPTGPVLLTAEAEADLLAVVMPMRV